MEHEEEALRKAAEMKELQERARRKPQDIAALKQETPDPRAETVHPTGDGARSSSTFALTDLRKLLEEPKQPTALHGPDDQTLSDQLLSTEPEAAHMNRPQRETPDRLDQDPTVFLRPPSKASEKYLKITDFVFNSIPQRDEHLVNEYGGTKLVLTSSQRKPRLDNVSIQQWVIASNRILYELFSTGQLSHASLPDYLSYNVKVMELAQRFEWRSVLKYDDEYRYLQACYSFRWGSDSHHLHTVYLHPLSSPSKKAGVASSAFTADGREICRKFNSREGCSYKDCKYFHCCSKPSCQGQHAAHQHSAVTTPKST